MRYFEEVLKETSRKKKFESSKTDYKKLDFIIISVREYELLIEVLNRNKTLFFECINELFDRDNFYKTMLEPFQIVYKYAFSKLGIDYTPMQEKVNRFAKDEYMENVKSKIFKRTTVG